MTLDCLDMWRLADDISVLDASILINNGNPAELLAGPTYLLKRVYSPRSGKSGKLQDRLEAVQEPEMARQRQADIKTAIEAEAQARKNLDQSIRSVYKVLQKALLNDRLTATFVFDPGNGERQFKGKYSDLPPFQENDALRLFDIDWEKTTISVCDLREWLEAKNTFPEFFFPTPLTDSFENPRHARYSAELACAVAAWNSVKAAAPGKTVRATIEEWVAANAVRFGVDQGDGTPSSQSVKRITTLVNWKKEGGAPATPQGDGYLK